MPSSDLGSQRHRRNRVGTDVDLHGPMMVVCGGNAAATHTAGRSPQSVAPPPPSPNPAKPPPPAGQLRLALGPSHHRWLCAGNIILCSLGNKRPGLGTRPTAERTRPCPPINEDERRLLMLIVGTGAYSYLVTEARRAEGCIPHAEHRDAHHSTPWTLDSGSHWRWPRSCARLSLRPSLR